MPSLRTSAAGTGEMSVAVVIPAGLSIFTGNEETIEVTGGTVLECLEDLASRYPAMESVMFFEKGKLFNFGHNRISVFINGTDAGRDTLSKTVNNGDTLQIVLAISGG